MARKAIFILALLCGGGVHGALAQAPVTEQAAADTAERLARAPFAPGERLYYAISFGPIHVGSAELELAAGDTLRDTPTYHATFRIHGGTFFFRVDDRSDSWFRTTDFASLRFTQRIREGRYHADRDFELFPERGFYTRGDDTVSTVAEPLDDASFLYFVRDLSLAVGKRYEYARYFQQEGNPIVLQVARAEHITVPAGSFDAVVVQPLIRTRGIFSDRGRAEVWLRTDGAHEVLQVKSHLAFGSLNLYLTRIEP